MKTLLLSFFLLLSLDICAQKENNIWAFGFGQGVDFNSGSPVSYTTTMISYEGCASVCDKDGNLLFYSNGQTVWNKAHQPMPNGKGLKGNSYVNTVGIPGSATQGVGILQFIDSLDKFYLFVLDSDEDAQMGTNRVLRYSVIDMSLDSGRGDVELDRRNIAIDSFLSEKMVLVKGSGCNNWLIVHHIDSPEFHSFHIGLSGLNKEMVKSKSGPAHIYPKVYSLGEMKISPDKQLLAVPTSNKKGCEATTVELHSFDIKTGVVHNYQQLDSFGSCQYVYGLCFSPDNQKIFLSVKSPFVVSVQRYNISALPDTAAVRKTRLNLPFYEPSTVFLGGIRLGPDNKLYIARACEDDLGEPTNTLCVIDDPNADNPFLGFHWDAGFKFTYRPETKVRKIFLGIGNPAITAKGKASSLNAHVLPVCDSLSIKVPSYYSEFIWNDGSHSSERSIKAPGKKWVYSTLDDCTADTFTVTLIAAPVYLGPDIRNCDKDTIHLSPDYPYTSYLWSDSSTGSSLTVDYPGTFWVRTEKDGCISSDTIIIKDDCKNRDTVIIRPDSTNCVHIPNSFTPNGDGRNDKFSVILSCPADDFKIIIVNRYGQEIFSAADVSHGWDGKFQSMDAELGVYYYLVRVRIGGQEKWYKGDIALLR